MQENEIEALGSVLQGEYMGIDSYQKHLNHIRSEVIRRDLERHEKDLRDMASELSSYIRNLGNPAPESAGIAGAMAAVGESIKLMGNPSEKDVVDDLYAGVQMGVEQTRKVLTGLSGEARMVANRHLRQNETILEELNHFRTQLQ